MGDATIDLEPAVELDRSRLPCHPCIVGISNGDHTARFGDPTHLGQNGDRIGHVLQHLVGVDDVGPEPADDALQRLLEPEGEADNVYTFLLMRKLELKSDQFVALAKRTQSYLTSIG